MNVCTCVKFALGRSGSLQKDVSATNLQRDIKFRCRDRQRCRFIKGIVIDNHPGISQLVWVEETVFKLFAKIQSLVND